jgi:hypothetical protein
VDWEAAFRNDRYNDLAVFANFIAANEGEERLYLQEYFGHPPDGYQAARFFAMQQIVHLFYAMAYLWLGSSGKPADLSEPVPEFTAFHRRIWTGEMDLREKAAQIAYGRVHWAQLARNRRQNRWAEAMRIVADRHGVSSGTP